MDSSLPALSTGCLTSETPRATHTRHPRLHLAAVKDNLFHPRLPSIRRMDMDTATNKLPEEHCRTSTTCGPNDFERAKLMEFRSPTEHLHIMDSTPYGRSLQPSLSTSNLLKSRPEWASFLDSPQEDEVHTARELNSKDFQFKGYKIRVTKPSVSGSWQYVLRHEPVLDQYGLLPLPANIYARYNDTTPQYGRDTQTETWRNF